MKALVQDRYGSADVLALREIAKPEPGNGEILVRVHAIGIDPGIWHITAGEPYLVRVMGFGLRRPKNQVRGDIAGRVEAVGADVAGFQPGDEVLGTSPGCLAEYTCGRADRFVLKPANLSFEQAAALPVSGYTALQGLRDNGRVRPGDKVLIIGAAGGVGTYAVQLAKAFGAHVTGVCSTAKADLVRSIGADEVIDYTTEDVTAGTRRYDLILDTAGNRPVSRLRRVLVPKGTLVLVGAESGARWTGGIGRLLRAGLLSLLVSQNLRGFLAKENPADLQILRQYVEDGKVTPVIDRIYPFDEAQDAIRYVRKGHSAGKVVVTG